MHNVARPIIFVHVSDGKSEDLYQTYGLTKGSATDGKSEESLFRLSLYQRYKDVYQSSFLLDGPGHMGGKQRRE